MDLNWHVMPTSIAGWNAWFCNKRHSERAQIMQEESISQKGCSHVIIVNREAERWSWIPTQRVAGWNIMELGGVLWKYPGVILRDRNTMPLFLCQYIFPVISLKIGFVSFDMPGRYGTVSRRSLPRNQPGSLPRRTTSTSWPFFQRLWLDLISPLS